MPKKNLRATSVARLKPPVSGRIEYFDQTLPGFALRITDKGRKSWTLLYRIAGRQRRLTLGTYPALSLADARKAAREALQRVGEGIDPAIAKAKRKEGKDTWSYVAREFIDRYSKPRNRTWKEAQRMFELHVNPYWADRDISSITRRDVIELIDRIADRGTPIRANRVLAAIRRLFQWAVERDILDANPAANVKPPGKETERDRVLSDDEIKAIWDACDRLDYPFGPFTRMLFVTAQRRDEVAKMRWSDLDLENRLWTIPREQTKGDRSHEVPLSPLAVEILRSVPRCGDYVFMSGRVEDRPISGFGKAKARLDEISGATDWRFHDLRRTAGTNLARSGTPVSTISRVLNHVEGGVTKIYARYSYLDEKRHALDTWARKLDGIVRPVETNLVPLRKD